MNFKKLLIGTMCTVFLGSMLIGCGGSETNSTATDATTAATVENTDVRAEYKKGTVTDKVYTNEWAGIKFTVPDGYIIMTSEQVGQAMESGVDTLYDDEETGQQVLDSAQQATDAYELMVTNASNGENVIVMVQNLGMSLTEDQMLEVLKAQLANTNMNPTFKDAATRTVAGIEFTEMTYSFTQNGQTLNQTMLFKAMGDYMMMVNFTYQTEEGFNKMLAGFSAL